MITQAEPNTRLRVLSYPRQATAGGISISAMAEECHERLRRELAREELGLLKNGALGLAGKPGIGVKLICDALQRYEVA